MVTRRIDEIYADIKKLEEERLKLIEIQRFYEGPEHVDLHKPSKKTNAKALASQAKAAEGEANYMEAERLWRQAAESTGGRWKSEFQKSADRCKQKAAA